MGSSTLRRHDRQNAAPPPRSPPGPSGARAVDTPKIGSILSSIHAKDPGELIDMRIDPKAAARLEEMGLEFTLAVLREETARHPGNFEALCELASLLTRIQRYEEGLAIDLRLAAIQPGSPIVFYNLSCTYSLLGRLDEAFRALRRAIELGFDDRELLSQDEDLAAVRRDRRFREILTLLQQLKTSG